MSILFELKTYTRPRTSTAEILSASRLRAPLADSTTPRTITGRLPRTTGWHVAHRPAETTTLIMPVSSSRFRNVTPRAVGGRWVWVIAPPTNTRVPCSTPGSAAAGSTSLPSRWARSS